jgi:DNA polymerase III epsilon subunit-like protein
MNRNYNLLNIFQTKCKHRHSRKDHPNCFDSDGKVKESFSKKGQFPKILLFDIEMLMMEVYSWGLYDQYISPDNIIKGKSILSWSAKWLFESRVYSEVLTPEQAINRDDSSILGTLWDLLNEADIVVTHNGNRYDIKEINFRFIVNGFPPPMYYRSVDTLAVARAYFKFPSNKLDEINKSLGLSQKIHTNYELWKRCAVGERQALKEMVTYNIQDVSALEETYVTLRPWMKNHPNIGIYYVNADKDVCSCGSTDLKFDGSTYDTNKGRYKSFRCSSCGAIGRSKVNINTKKYKKDRSNHGS